MIREFQVFYTAPSYRLANHYTDSEFDEPRVHSPSPDPQRTRPQITDRHQIVTIGSKNNCMQITILLSHTQAIEGTWSDL